MLVACRLASLSALEADHTDVNADARFARAEKSREPADGKRDRVLRRRRLVVAQLSICWPPLDQRARRWARSESNISRARRLIAI
jgi:hypothetical protein